MPGIFRVILPLSLFLCVEMKENSNRNEWNEMLHVLYSHHARTAAIRLKRASLSALCTRL